MQNFPVLNTAEMAAVGQETITAQGNQSSSDVTKGPFDHPVYKKLAILNGEINKMTKQEMAEKLGQLHLDTRYVINKILVIIDNC